MDWRQPLVAIVASLVASVGLLFEVSPFVSLSPLATAVVGLAIATSIAYWLSRQPDWPRALALALYVIAFLILTAPIAFGSMMLFGVTGGVSAIATLDTLTFGSVVGTILAIEFVVLGRLVDGWSERTSANQ